MNSTSAPQFIEHISHSVTYTPFDFKWIPCSARFSVIGQTPRAKGIFQIYKMNEGKLEIINEIVQGNGYKCSTFGASSLTNRELAVGDFDGNVSILDLEKGKPNFNVKGHNSIINTIDGIGGFGNIGPAEIITGGRDGSAKIWDPRTDKPVVNFEPASTEKILPECWAVAFGNAFNSEERCVGIGYDNGDIKLFDLRMNCLKWETNLKNGICSLEFDRKDIEMNKLVATTLESKIHVFDLKTLHPEFGYAGLSEAAHNSTIWGARHLPQNRDIFVSLGGNGSMNIYKYIYPNQRLIKDENGLDKGVIGSLEILNSKDITTQPIVSFDWNVDKLGLSGMVALDQSIKIYLFTRLNIY